MNDVLTNVTKSKKFSFIETVVASGKQPEYINNCGEVYDYTETVEDKYIYRNDDEDIELYIEIPKHVMNEAQQLHRIVDAL